MWLLQQAVNPLGNQKIPKRVRFGAKSPLANSIASVRRGRIGSIAVSSEHFSPNYKKTARRRRLVRPSIQKMDFGRRKSSWTQEMLVLRRTAW